jgi:hypothetical protein
MYYQLEGIPSHWISKLALLPLLEIFADELMSLSEVCPFQPEHPPSLSDRYKELQLAYSPMEKAYKDILRKLLPGPRKYKTMDEFENDVKEFVAEATKQKGELAERLLVDFNKRFDFERTQLQRQLKTPSLFSFQK